MKKQIVWGIMTLCGLASVALADIIYPANNGFEVTDMGASTRITYASETNTTLAPGWTLYGGGGATPNLVALTANGWTGLAAPNNNLTNGNSDGTTSTYGQALQFRGGDGFYGANATTASAYISTPFTLSQSYSNVTVQFDYRGRYDATYANLINVYIVASDNTVFSLGGKQQITAAMVNFSTPTSASLAAGTHTLYLVGAVNNASYASLVDNVQITAIPEPATAGTLFLGAIIAVTIRRLNK